MKRYFLYTHLLEKQFVKYFSNKNFKNSLNLLTIFMVKYVSMDEYIKRKISNKLKGRKKNNKTKDLISKAMKGKVKSQEHKEAISYGMKRYWYKHQKEAVKTETSDTTSLLLKVTKPVIKLNIC